jgi:hypothetical protein
VDAADGGRGRACGRNPAAQKPEHRGQRCLATTARSRTSAAVAGQIRATCSTGSNCSFLT